jgi:AMMECR1 domain-containing protein
MMPVTPEEGQILVRVARDSVERLFSDKGPRSQQSVQSKMQAGVFVSIHNFSADETP